MTEIIIDIISIFFVLILGFFAGKRAFLSQDQAQGLNKLVLNFCLPAVLFMNIMKSTREELFSDVRFFIVTIIVLLGWYIIAFLGAMFIYKHNKQEAGIAGLSAAAPTVGFLGIAVLAPMFGSSAALSVAVVALVVNVLQIPLGMFFVTPAGSSPISAVIKAIKEPVVLAPILGFILVLLDIKIPAEIAPYINQPLSLIAHANSGVAVFAAGLVISAHKLLFSIEVVSNCIIKMIFVPASMLILGLLVGIPHPHLEQAVLLAALPPAFTGMVMAGRFQTYVQQAASTLIICVISFAILAPVWIFIIQSLFS